MKKIMFFVMGIIALSMSIVSCDTKSDKSATDTDSVEVVVNSIDDTIVLVSDSLDMCAE